MTAMNRYKVCIGSDFVTSNNKFKLVKLTLHTMQFLGFQ